MWWFRRFRWVQQVQLFVIVCFWDWSPEASLQTIGVHWFHWLLSLFPNFSAFVGIPPGQTFLAVNFCKHRQGPSHPCGHFFTLVDAVSKGGQVKTESIAGVPSVLSEDQSGIDAAVEMAKKVDTVLLGSKSDQVCLHTSPEYSDELAGAEWNEVKRLSWSVLNYWTMADQMIWLGWPADDFFSSPDACHMKHTVLDIRTDAIIVTQIRHRSAFFTISCPCVHAFLVHRCSSLWLALIFFIFLEASCCGHRPLMGGRGAWCEEHFVHHGAKCLNTTSFSFLTQSATNESDEHGTDGICCCLMLPLPFYIPGCCSGQETCGNCDVHCSPLGHLRDSGKSQGPGSKIWIDMAKVIKVRGSVNFSCSESVGNRVAFELSWPGEETGLAELATPWYSLTHAVSNGDSHEMSWKDIEGCWCCCRFIRVPICWCRRRLPSSNYHSL